MASVRQKSVQAAFQLADVALDLLSDEHEHIRWHRANERSLQFGAQDGNPRLEIRRLEVGDQAPLESRPQTILQNGHGLRRTVARQDDLPARLVDGVEGVEKLLLGALLSANEQQLR